MKRFLLLLTIMYLPVQAQESSIIKIETEASALVLKVGKNKKLYQTYLGTKLNNSAEYEAVSKENTKNFVVNDGNPLIDLRHSAYPTFGTDNLFEPAIRITHNDGNPSLELEYQNHTIQKIDNNTAEIIIKLKDPEYPVFVNLHYKTFYKENVIESWTEILHNEKKPVMLYNYASSALHLDADQYWLTQFYSDVVEEVRMEESQLTRGIKVIDSKLGVRTNMFASPSFFLSLNSK